MEYGLKQYIFVIRELTAREIKRKYSRSVFGILWSVLNPLLYMVVMSVVLSGYSLDKETYPIYYITGYTLWSMFSTATSTAMTAFIDNRNLFQKSKLPREVFVVSRVYTAFVNLLFSCIAMVLVLIFYRIKLNWTVFIFAIDVFFELIFTIGFSFLLATIYVLFKDIQYIWKNTIVLLVHMVAVLYPLERYPEKLHKITKLNPMYIYPNIARRCVLEGMYDLDELKLMVIWAFISIVLGMLVFKIFENEMVKRL